MAPNVLVGAGQFTYRVDSDWERLPEGFSHLDVSGLAVDSAGRLFVFNRSEHPVIIYTPNGHFSGTWGEGIFTNPHGIRIDQSDCVYCVDDFDHTVRKFTPDGKLLWTLGSKGVASDTGFRDSDYRTIVHGGPPFNRPTNLAIATDGTLYVTDGYGNARVHCFTPDGKFQFSWGAPGSKPGEFNIPHSIAIDRRERILVADRENNRIQVFSRDGDFLEQWTDLIRPCDMAIDSRGYIFVAELGLFAGPYPFDPLPTDQTKHSRVSVLDQHGKVQAQWGNADFCADGSFYAAHCITIGLDGNIFVGEVNESAGEGKVPKDCHTLQRFSSFQAA